MSAFGNRQVSTSLEKPKSRNSHVLPFNRRYSVGVVFVCIISTLRGLHTPFPICDYSNTTLVQQRNSQQNVAFNNMPSSPFTRQTQSPILAGAMLPRSCSIPSLNTATHSHTVSSVCVDRNTFPLCFIKRITFRPIFLNSPFRTSASHFYN